MIIGLVFVFIGCVFFPLVSSSSLGFWPKWPRMLVTGEFSDPVVCLL